MERRDDTRDEARDVLGGIDCVRRALSRLNGFGTSQRSALLAAQDRLSEARAALLAFLRDRESMLDATL